MLPDFDVFGWRLLTGDWLLLKIQPVIHLKHNRPVLVFHERIREIVVRIYQEYITHRFIPPLQAAVYIEVIILAVVLKKGCPKKVIGEVDLYTWCHQDQVGISIRVGEIKPGILKIQGKITPGLGAPGYRKAPLK